MRVSTMASVFDSYYPHLVCVRQFAWGKVVTSIKGAPLILIVQENGNPEHTLYEYEDINEYLEDVARVRRFGGNDDPGVPALVSPNPPILSGKDAKPLPASEDETDSDIGPS